jgi:predicted RNA-binding Zn-ribbon protein involved in translation (DUF1610 family)
MKRQTLKKLLTAYLITVAIASVVIWTIMVYHGPPEKLGPIAAVVFPIAAAIALFIFFLMIGIGMFVYQDSKTSGMEPVLWVIVAVLVPYFIGLIAYLLIRHPVQVTCPSCGHRVSSDASFCPRCGKELKFLCTQCRQPLAASSRFCPSCGTEIAKAEDTDN